MNHSKLKCNSTSQPASMSAIEPVSMLQATSLSTDDRVKDVAQPLLSADVSVGGKASFHLSSSVKWMLFVGGIAAAVSLGISFTAHLHFQGTVDMELEAVTPARAGE